MPLKLKTGDAQSERLISQADISSKPSQLNVSKHVAGALPFSLLSRHDIYLQICAANPRKHSHELMYKAGMLRSVAFFAGVHVFVDKFTFCRCDSQLNLHFSNNK